MAQHICSVAGCEKPIKVKSKRLCAMHYARLSRTGSVHQICRTCGGEFDGTYKQRYCSDACVPAALCVICGKPVPPSYARRTVCSGKCQVLEHGWRSRGGRPTTTPCVRCGTAIDLLAIGRGGHRRRADVKMCDRCRNDSRKHTMTVAEIARRDGETCKICGESVDMSLRKPDNFSASVDHIMPRSLGGLDVPENYQLAHLWCNQIKQQRVGFTI